MLSDLLDFGTVGESEKVGFPGIWRWETLEYFRISTGGHMQPPSPRTSCGTQKTLTSGVDFTQDSLAVLGSLLSLQNPLPFLCTSSFAMRPRTWWRRVNEVNYMLLIVN